MEGYHGEWIKDNTRELGQWQVEPRMCVTRLQNPIELESLGKMVQGKKGLHDARIEIRDGLRAGLRMAVEDTRAKFLEQTLKLALDEISCMKRELDDIKTGRAVVLQRVEANPNALDELFEMIDTLPPKFKTHKELEEWLEEER